MRSIADLGPETMILAVLPHLRPKRAMRRLGPIGTRRGIGYTAGADPLRESGRKVS